MFTDLVGFTKLGQRDEEAALELRREHQALARPVFAAYGGREVKTTGDGFLVEFPSAVESVRCAVEVQSALGVRNAAASSKPPITLRIGIHLGDVVGDGDDIVGDAVNVASRIEPLAEPGGICVSASVYDQVRNKLAVRLEKLGARQLKNVELPLELYRVVPSGTARPPSAWERAADQGLRLAVLPFANLSPDPNDDYFADGLTDELISQASKIPNLRVVARTSVLRYKGSSKPIRDVGQELSVRLALEGTVRKAGERLRITAQLVDTASEVHLWSSRYDRSFDDIFSIQEDIASRIAGSIGEHIAQGSARSPPSFVAGSPDTEDLEAYSEFLHGRKLLAEKGSEETIRQALALFEAAVRRDPSFARARVGVAECSLWLSSEGAVPYAEANERARTELRRALELNEKLAEAHSVLAGLLVGDDDVAGAERESRRAMELNPSLADPYRWLAQLASGDGRIEETVRWLEAGLRLDPVDINLVAFLGRAYAYAGRDADALAHWDRTRSLVPFRTAAHMTEFFLGREDYQRAADTVRELERLRPNSAWTETYRGILAARTGDTATARASLQRLELRAQKGDLTDFFAGFVHYALGEQDAFVACLERAFKLHALPLLELTYSRLFAPARQDPRVLDLLRRQSELGNGRPDATGRWRPTP
jgi:adenylate cyclase